MALNPELIRRRKRIELPRAPERPLGGKAKELGQPVRSPEEELKALLEQLVAEAKSNTLFTITLERDRLFSALYYAGFVLPVFGNIEVVLGPLAATTVFLNVPPGTVLVPRELNATVSLPWFLASSFWLDSEPPAAPLFFLTRGPETYHFTFGGIVPIRRFVRLTLFNSHLVNTLNFCAITEFGFMAENAWKMLETIYLKPIAEYAQKKAEELTGRPFP